MSNLIDLITNYNEDFCHNNGDYNVSFMWQNFSIKMNYCNNGSKSVTIANNQFYIYYDWKKVHRDNHYYIYVSDLSLQNYFCISYPFKEIFINDNKYSITSLLDYDTIDNFCKIIDKRLLQVTIGKLILKINLCDHSIPDRNSILFEFNTDTKIFFDKIETSNLTIKYSLNHSCSNILVNDKMGYFKIIHKFYKHKYIYSIYHIPRNNLFELVQYDSKVYIKTNKSTASFSYDIDHNQVMYLIEHNNRHIKNCYLFGDTPITLLKNIYYNNFWSFISNYK